MSGINVKWSLIQVVLVLGNHDVCLCIKYLIFLNSLSHNNSISTLIKKFFIQSRGEKNIDAT